MFDDRFDRRETRACREADDRALRILAQEEIAERNLDLHAVAELQLPENAFRKMPATDMADMQLRAVAFLRRIGKRCRRAILSADTDPL